MAVSTTLDYDDLPALLTELTGDEKHDWSALSTLDVLWVLYDRVLRLDPRAPDDPERDRFLLSKGHGPAAYYAVLAAKGFIDVDDLAGFGGFDSPLGYHPDHVLVARRGDLERLARPRPADRGGHDPRPRGARAPAGARVVCLVGDAELDEGSNWEAVQLAGRLGLGRLTAVVVDNRLLDLPLAGRDRGALRARGLERGARRRPRPRRARAGAGARPASGPHVVVAEVAAMTTMRKRFYERATRALDDDPRTAIVLAEIGASELPAPRARVQRRHPRAAHDRRRRRPRASRACGPIVHSYAPFLVERPYEQIKLDLGHQDVGRGPRQHRRLLRRRPVGPHAPGARRRRAARRRCRAGRSTSPATPTSSRTRSRGPLARRRPRLHPDVRGVQRGCRCAPTG